MFLDFSHAPYPKGTGYQRVIFFLGGTLYMRAHSMRNSNRILHGDQTILEENSTGSFTRQLPWTKISVTRMPTAICLR